MGASASYSKLLARTPRSFAHAPYTLHPRHLAGFLFAAALLALGAAATEDSVVTHPTAPLPKPPCYSALNPDLETPCSRTVATDLLTNVTIRSYEAGGGAVATFLSATQPGELNYQQGLETCIEIFISYFSPGFNRELTPVNRTVPIVSIRLGSPADPFNYKWASGMALPESVYPTSATAPQPENPIFLTFTTPFVANPLVAVHHFVTPLLPTDQDWAVAAGYLAAHVPRGYRAVAGAAPVFAIYNGRASTAPRDNEVWLQVVKG